MSRSLSQQVLEALERSNRPLIVLGEKPSIDDFVTAFAFASLIAKFEKPVDIATSEGQIPKNIHFLKAPFIIQNDLPHLKTLLLSISSQKAKLEELRYETTDDGVHIHIVPKTGLFDEEDIQIHTDHYRYDLILTIGVQELTQLGSLYKQYADFFFQTPIINIDHNPQNEYFGQINLVQIKAVSSSEIAFSAIRSMDESLLDEELATYFLTGMIQKTRSFRAPEVNPQTLKVASELVSLGARRDEIVQSLYRTRSIGTLRLWGRALARIQSHVETGLVWTVLSRQDFIHAGAQKDAVEDVVEELMMSSPHTKAAVLFYEDNGHVRAKIHTARPYDALALGAPFTASGTGEQASLFLRNIDIIQAEQRVIEHIQTELEQYQK